ncbi:hypothetical protein A0128_06800 [Leptospira tipperaryensis]|uniref:Glycosyltransferase RgtA/B/C/D-like domain-containing protein n=1 Tax=Leptospira tipperaryensis TaxID=2564040 RepID=A0A1D7UVM4_9LEPT|nr:hypothetical protein [Leptospira tipperaryensis]AOP33581.1 hypothetical protein A0128_06800 [Leptospira tipperaryensis]
MDLKKKISDFLNKNRFFFPIFSGLTTLLVFKIVLGFFPEELYINRDDGIITLSHAKNWIDFGFIGVNPSGELIEGYSSPLEFFIFAFVYKIVAIHYSIFFTLQWWLTTFLFGAVLYKLFEEIRETSEWENFGLTLLTTALLSVSFTFLAWHASGMENPWMHLLYIVYLLILFQIANGKDVSLVGASLLLFAGTLVRIESVFHLFFISVVFLFISFRNRVPWKKTLPVWIAGGLWILFFLIRFFYFGKIFPNTSTAQELSLGENALNLIRLSPALSKNWEIFKFGFKQNGILLIPISLLLLFFRRINEKEKLFVILAFALAVPGFLHPFIFGNYRLDPARPMTWLAVLGAVLFVIRSSAITEKKKFLILPLVLLAGFLSYKNYKFKSYDLCCSSKIFEERRAQISEIAKKEEITRPLVAIADLGALSFYKEFNIFDLGYLGNRYLAANKKDAGRVASYIDLNRPDILEVHFPWSCEYSKFLNRSEFSKNYKLIVANTEKVPISVCPDGGKIFAGIYLNYDMEKNSGSIDREVYSSFVKDSSLKNLKSQVALCNSKKERCLPLIRNFYRFLNECKENIRDSEFTEAVNEISNSNVREYMQLIWTRSSPSEALVEGLIVSLR